MRRLLWSVSAGTLVAALVLAGFACQAWAAKARLSGNWKVVVLLGSKQLSLVLVKIDTGEGEARATLLSTGHPEFKKATIGQVGADTRKLDLTIRVGKLNSFPVTVYIPQGEKMPKKLLGSMGFRGKRLYAWLERTDIAELDPEKSEVESPSGKDLQEAAELDGEKAREKAYRDLEKKYAADPLARVATLQILSLMASNETVKEADLRAQAEKAVQLASQYGPEMKLQVTGQVAQLLAGSKTTTDLAIAYAREALKAVTPSTPYDQRAALLETIVTALRSAGKNDEAARADAALDVEFHKYAVPFKPVKYGGRASKSDRVVVLELFTGVQCPPCVAADVAFDALLTRYKPSEVVLLQYHLNIPGPDPLTNKDSEARAEFYGGDDDFGTPTLFIDGKKGPTAGGGRADGKSSYDEIHQALDKEIEEEAGGKLKLTASRQGDQIEIAAEAADLKKSGQDIRLHLVLVEDVARYPGSNGQRFHHHVVRAMPGGTNGYALDKKSTRQTATISLKDLTRALNAYLQEKEFDAKDRPLDLKRLKVVALIQDSKTKEILQAAQVDVREK
jgi:hypothetical protein